MRAKTNTVKRVLRGGGGFVGSWDLRVPFRYRDLPEERDRDSGFRVVIRKKA